MISSLEPMKTSDRGTTRMVRMLGKDCGPLQFVREFTQNSLEAILRTGEPGTLIVDVNWEALDFDAFPGVFKLSFTDTGDGMTGDEVCKYINHMASSGFTNEYENYGVGAKIASIIRNEYGIWYESWKDGQGAWAWFYYDSEQDAFGLMRIKQDDGSYTPFVMLDEAQMPELIRENGGHGTRVTLLGMTADNVTMEKPKDAPYGSHESWLLRALNSRYFEFPESVDLKVRIGFDRPRDNTKHNYLAKATGQKATAEKFSVKSGAKKLSDATVHWYILEQNRDGHGRENITGHTAVVHQGELFEYTHGRSNRAATEFGIVFGASDVMLYVEPGDNYRQNISRGNLQDKDGNALPWERWGGEFRNDMPEELAEYIKALAAASASESHTDSIREKLKGISKLYQLTRFRKAPRGKIEIDPDTMTTHSTGHGGHGHGGGKGKGGVGDNPGKHAQLLTAFAKAGSGVMGSKVKPDPFPPVSWISREAGNRSDDELEDRAATFLEEAFIIKANADFQGFRDVIEVLIEEWGHIPEAPAEVVKLVQAEYELILTETVAGALSFKNRPGWTQEEFERAISDEALTTAVMTRLYPLREVKRALSGRFRNKNKSVA